jgi:GTP pyrophosphokinase
MQLLDRIGNDYGPDARALVERGLELATRGQRTADAMATALETAEVIERLHLDPPTIAAGTVLAAFGSGAITPPELVAALGPEVAALCEGVGRLDLIHWDRLEEEASENLRKMFLALASDIRVVLLALADRVRIMRRLDALPANEAQRRAHETQEVYAPLANRLGIWQLKWELEDLAFRHLAPEVYRDIKRWLAEKRAARTRAIEDVIALVQRKLDEAAIEAEVVGRPKHIYSIYKKMQRKQIEFEHIYDVSAVRIIVAELEDCYAALGLVHGEWTPIPGEFDDYIAKPKENFYRSLHTAVIGPGGGPLEIQIRTQQMHDYNEFGVAAHWRYKEAKKADRRFDEKIDWLRQLMRWQKDVTDGSEMGDPRDLAESLKTDIFQDQVFVFTPTGEIIDLPLGSTPIDFAYRIHTEVGHRCRGAKVRGQIVPLDYRLQTGDAVEIITAKSGVPSRDWLNPHQAYTQTSGARQKIRQFFRQQKRETSIAQGRDLVERELKRVGLDAARLDALTTAYPQYATLDDVLAALGFGDISVQSVAARLLELERKDQEIEPPVPSTKPVTKERATSVSIAGVDDVMSHPARCCSPVPGDAVVGFITRGRGVAIHRRDCPNARHPQEPERWMPLTWGPDPGHVYPVDIQIVAYDRKGLLRDIADAVSAEGINMLSTSARSDGREDTAVIDATLQIRQSEQIVRILGRLERLPDVLWARRVSG